MSGSFLHAVRPSTIGWALAGVLGGHELTYAILYPDGGHRHEALAESGHAWIGLLAPGLVIAIAIAIVSGVLGGRRRTSARGTRFAVLLVVQVALFVAIEIGERIGAGMTLRTVPHEIAAHGLLAILGLGALIQVAAAWLGSAASRLVARVAVRLRRPGVVVPRPRHIPLSTVRARPIVAPMVRAHGSRGPPHGAGFPIA